MDKNETEKMRQNKIEIMFFLCENIAEASLSCFICFSCYAIVIYITSDETRI